ncbi:hypothetical protein A2Z33_04840 [Candidatus Gottesmanbacteria bacterium RBG_16_52_11]|uniref:SCP domain-containing protein n=1 Tax=Candidatus Gottesmanbacteria bacterium RBG_16_52_11 TaxID=1798374 RepID=A0A1F5YUJ2_9BACT|nr:MAG: hypothetical protein A2Z33_04840 [Candidatus Gottesmanbacteria bacterium RBG_16_52_11]
MSRFRRQRAAGYRVMDLLPLKSFADLIIVIFLVVFTAEGWRSGFVQMAGSMAGLMLAVIAANAFHLKAAGLVSVVVPVTAPYAGILVYLVIAVGTMVTVAVLLTTLLRSFLLRFAGTKLDALAGSLVSFGNGLIIVTIVLLLAEKVPFTGPVRTQLTSSRIAGGLTAFARSNFPDIAESLTSTASGAVRFLTVRPGSAERITLNVNPENWDLIPDEQAESEMLLRVNEIRAARGAAPLKADEPLRQIARFRSHDMFVNRYFSHYDDNGREVSDYLDAEKIPYRFVGENLAYAPDIGSALEGLLKSDTHRANMLDRKYTRTGIGVIDSPRDGKIITQIFVD